MEEYDEAGTVYVWVAPSGMDVYSTVPQQKLGGICAAWEYALRKYLLGERLGG